MEIPIFDEILFRISSLQGRLKRSNSSQMNCGNLSGKFFQNAHIRGSMFHFGRYFLAKLTQNLCNFVIPGQVPRALLKQ